MPTATSCRFNFIIRNKNQSLSVSCHFIPSKEMNISKRSHNLLLTKLSWCETKFFMDVESVKCGWRNLNYTCLFFLNVELIHFSLLQLKQAAVFKWGWCTVARQVCTATEWNNEIPKLVAIEPCNYSRAHTSGPGDLWF